MQKGFIVITLSCVIKTERKIEERKENAYIQIYTHHTYNIQYNKETWLATKKPF